MIAVTLIVILLVLTHTVCNAFMVSSGARVANRLSLPLTMVHQSKRYNASVFNRIQKYASKSIGNMIIIASSIASLPVNRIRFNGLVPVITAVTTLRPYASHAGILKRYNRQRAPYEKLATTPLFFVSNSGGSPYLQEDVQAGKPSQRIITYFMSSEDANEYLNEIAQGSPQNVNEFRLTVTSMEKIMKKIQLRKQSRKLGRYEINNIYRIQPSSRQCENADKVVANLNNARKIDKKIVIPDMKHLAIPMFSAQGMAMERRNGEIITPYYFAYEDLLEDWNTMAESNKEDTSDNSSPIPATPTVVVSDFTDIMCLSQGVTSELLEQSTDEAEETEEIDEEDSTGLTQSQVKAAVKNPAVIPPRREIDMVKSYYRNKSGIKNEFSDSKIVSPGR